MTVPQEKPRVVRVESDTHDGGLTVTIHVARPAAGMLLAEPTPRVDDVPVDIRAALVGWLTYRAEP